MVKSLSDAEREKLREGILRQLSVDGRASSRDIAKPLGAGKSTINYLMRDIVKEYGLQFVPEINIENLWKWEFVKQTRAYTKRGIMENVLEKIPKLGFDEYIILFKFINDSPTDEELIEAVNRSNIVQYMARLHGGYHLVIYAVARSYEDANDFIINFSGSLKKYTIRSRLNKILRNFGFFPLRPELLKELNITDTHASILRALNQNGRAKFSEIARGSKQDLANVIYAYNRLVETGVLNRITYYEGKPKRNISGIVQIEVTNEAFFLGTRLKWFIDMVNDSESEHTGYTFICDISNPQGILVFVNSGSSGEIEDFINKLKKNLKGVAIRYTLITKPLIGVLGIRNFDMRYTTQYRTLESEKLVPRFTPKKATKQSELIDDS